MTLVLWLIMNDGLSFDSSITCSKLFRVSWVSLGYIAGDRRQNLNPKKAPCSYQVSAMGKFALLSYLGEFWLRVSSFWSLETRESSHLGAQGTFNGALRAQVIRFVVSLTWNGLTSSQTPVRSS